VRDTLFGERILVAAELMESSPKATPEALKMRAPREI
jgi:hypothetical protein